jgi:D-alanyl-D-alanine carboxypeptidase
MNAALLILFVASVTAQIPAPVPAPPPSSSVDIERVREAIQTKLKELHRTSHFPGMTAGFVLPDGRSGSVAIGLADLEKKSLMQPSDRMLAGSIGKTFFSAVTLQLVAEGKLALDSRIKTWLGSEPWFDRLPNGPDITLRMLMNHTSGVPEHVLDPAFIAAVKRDPDKHWMPAEMVAYVLGKKPHFPAGEGWSYADTNYILAGMIIERVAGRDLYALVNDRLLKRFRLTSTSPSTTRVLPGLIPGHSGKGSPCGIEGPSIKDGKVIFNPQCEWAGGGFVSTSEDLARWARALYGGDVLTTESLEKLIAGVPAKTGKGDQYGLGVQIRLSPWGTSLGHGGWFPGYLSEMEFFSATRLAVAVQFNTDDMRSLGKHPRFFVAQVARAILSNIPEYPLSEKSDRAQIFAPGVVSTEDDEVGGAFNPDQTEFYFTKLSRYTTSPSVGLLCVSRRRDGRWTTPEALPFSGLYLDLPPRLSPDGKTMYFASSRPLRDSKARVLRIWSVSRQGESWGEPEPLPSPINQDTSWNWGPSVASDGTIYFTSTRDQSGHLRIYSSKLENGKYSPPERLGAEINSEFNESDPFISPDGKQLFFVATGEHASATRHRPEAATTGGFVYARGEIYVSRNEGGKWTNARHLGPLVNSVAEEGNPALSPDGKFLFFTTEKSPFVVPTERRMDIDALEAALHSIENGLGNVNYIALDALGLEDRP